MKKETSTQTVHFNKIVNGKVYSFEATFLRLFRPKSFKERQDIDIDFASNADIDQIIRMLELLKTKEYESEA